MHTHMVGGDRFTGSTHTDGICTQSLAHLNLCRGFIIWSGKLDIDALLQRNVQSCCRAADCQAEPVVIDIAHIRKTNAEFIDIGSDERGWHKACDLIADQHKITGMKIRIDATGGIG